MGNSLYERRVVKSETEKEETGERTREDDETNGDKKKKKNTNKNQVNGSKKSSTKTHNDDSGNSIKKDTISVVFMFENGANKVVLKPFDSVARACNSLKDGGGMKTILMKLTCVHINKPEGIRNMEVKVKIPMERVIPGKTMYRSDKEPISCGFSEKSNDYINCECFHEIYDKEKVDRNGGRNKMLEWAGLELDPSFEFDNTVDEEDEDGGVSVMKKLEMDDKSVLVHLFERVTTLKDRAEGLPAFKNFLDNKGVSVGYELVTRVNKETGTTVKIMSRNSKRWFCNFLHENYFSHIPYTNMEDVTIEVTVEHSECGMEETKVHEDKNKNKKKKKKKNDNNGNKNDDKGGDTETTAEEAKQQQEGEGEKEEGNEMRNLKVKQTKAISMLFFYELITVKKHATKGNMSRVEIVRMMPYYYSGKEDK